MIGFGPSPSQLRPLALQLARDLTGEEYDRLMKDGAARQSRQANRRSGDSVAGGGAFGGCAGDAVAILGADTSITFWSPGAERLTGWSATSVTAHSLADLFSGVDAAEITRGSRAGHALHAELVPAGGGGGYRPVELFVSPLLDKAGQLSGFAIVMRDSAGAPDAVSIGRDGGSVWSGKVRGGGAPVFLIDRTDTRILDVNDSATALLGLGIRDLAGHALDEVLRSRGAVAGPDAATNILDGGELSLPDAESDGLSRAYVASVVPLQFSGHPLAVVVMHEVTRWLDLEAELSRANLELSRMARHDHLTGLFNKPMFQDTLALANSRLERTGGMLGVLYIDLDGFKPVNDRFGHDAGDRVLVEVAQRVRRAVRASDVVARLGGDEFGAILENLRIPEDAQKVGRHIIEQIAEPLDMDGEQIVMSASIGAVVTDRMVPDSGALLIQADWQMYQAKATGHGQVSVGRVRNSGSGRRTAPGV